MKKNIIILIAILFFIPFNIIFANNNNDVPIINNGEVIKEKGKIVKGNTMVTEDVAAKILGVKAEGKDKIIITEDKTSTKLLLKVGEETAELNGLEKKTPAPYIENNKVMLPLRFLCDAFGHNIHWREDLRAVTIYGFTPEKPDYEYEKIYNDFIEGYLYMPKDYEDEVEFVKVTGGGKEELYLMKKSMSPKSDLQNGLFKFVKVTSPCDLREGFTMIRALKGNNLLLSSPITKDNISAKYEKALRTYSPFLIKSDADKRVFEGLKKYIPDTLYRNPMTLTEINGDYLYAMTKFENDDTDEHYVEYAAYITFDKDMNFKKFHLKSYNDKEIFAKKITFTEGKELCNAFAKDVLGIDSIELKEDSTLFINRYDKGKVESFADNKGGKYLVNLELGRIVEYNAK